MVVDVVRGRLRGLRVVVDMMMVMVVVVTVVAAAAVGVFTDRLILTI